jgi:hypothetical protein
MQTRGATADRRHAGTYASNKCKAEGGRACADGSLGVEIGNTRGVFACYASQACLPVAETAEAAETAETADANINPGVSSQ